MPRRLVVLLALVVAIGAVAAEPPPAHTETAAQRELREDICSAVQFASCGRAPNAICHAEDGIPDSELRARWARVVQLCRRYRDKYGAWLDNGCCDYVRRLDPEESKARAALFKESQQVDRQIASISPSDRSKPCTAFLAKFGYWPTSCSDAGLARPGTEQPPPSSARRP
jgi:hypothetical protein